MRWKLKRISNVKHSNLGELQIQQIEEIRNIQDYKKI